MFARTALACGAGFLLTFVGGVMAQACPKDHVSTTSLWNDPQQPWARCVDDAGTAGDAVLASAFVGNGGRVTRIAGVFTNDRGGPNPDPWWSQLSYVVLFYPGTAAFVADPFGASATSGVQKVTVAAPMNLDRSLVVGRRQFAGWSYDWHRLEFDVTAAGLQTTAATTHLVAVLPATGAAGSAVVGATLVALSTGQSGAVGTGIDWYRSNVTGIGPDTLPNLNAAHAHGALRVVLEAPATPLFSLATSSFATILRIEHTPLFGTLDLANCRWTLDGIDAWRPLLQGRMPAGVTGVASWLPAPAAFEIVFLGDLTAHQQQFSGCSLAGMCHATPPSR